MEYLITGLSITAMMGSVTAITTLANGVYSLSDRIIKSTDSGIVDIKRLIESSDLKNKIKIMGIFVKEIDVANKDNKAPHSITESINSIKIAVNEIEKELKEIQFRIDYNDNLYFTVGGTRAYKFGNSYKRLDSKIKTLNSRYDTLKSLFSMRHLLNPDKMQSLNLNLNGGHNSNAQTITYQTPQSIRDRMDDLDFEADSKIVDKIVAYIKDDDMLSGPK